MDRDDQGSSALRDQGSSGISSAQGSGISSSSAAGIRDQGSSAGKLSSSAAALSSSAQGSAGIIQGSAQGSAGIRDQGSAVDQQRRQKKSAGKLPSATMDIKKERSGKSAQSVVDQGSSDFQIELLLSSYTDFYSLRSHSYMSIFPVDCLVSDNQSFRATGSDCRISIVLKGLANGFDCCVVVHIFDVTIDHKQQEIFHSSVFHSSSSFQQKRALRKSALVFRSEESSKSKQRFFRKLRKYDAERHAQQRYSKDKLFHALSFQEERKRVFQYSLPELSLISLDFRFPVAIDGKFHPFLDDTLVIPQTIDNTSHNRFLLLISFRRIVGVHSAESVRLALPVVAQSLNLLDTSLVLFQRSKKNLVLHFHCFFSLSSESTFPDILRKRCLLRLLAEVLSTHVLERFRFLALSFQFQLLSVKLFLVVQRLRCFLLFSEHLRFLSSELFHFSTELVKLSFQFLSAQFLSAFDQIRSSAFDLFRCFLHFRCFLFHAGNFLRSRNFLSFRFLYFRCLRFHFLSANFRFLSFHFHSFSLDVTSNVICSTFHALNSPDPIVKDPAQLFPSRGKLATKSDLLTRKSRTYYYTKISVGFDVVLTRKCYFAVGLWLHLRYFQRWNDQQRSALSSAALFPISSAALSAQQQQQTWKAQARVTGFALPVTDGFGAQPEYAAGCSDSPNVGLAAKLSKPHVGLTTTPSNPHVGLTANEDNPDVGLAGKTSNSHDGLAEGSGYCDRAKRLFTASAERHPSGRRPHDASRNRRKAGTGSFFEKFFFEKKKTAAARRAA